MDNADQILTPRQIPAKILPPPTTVSPQLRRSIALMATLPHINIDPLPTTADEWRAALAVLDAESLKQVRAFAALFPHQMVERRMAGVTVREITPAALDPTKDRQRLLHLHGGAYTLNGGEAGLSEAILGAHYSSMRVVSVDYRMPPDHPFPAAVEDAVAVWNAMTQSFAPHAMGVFGSSAGGGLTLAMALKLKALGLPLPGALAPGTPWTDLTGQGDSFKVNAGVDGVVAGFDGFGAANAALYVGSADPRDPLISPVFGDFAGFPPTILTTGTRDVLLSDTVRVHRAMRAAGVLAQLEVHEAMSHAEYIFAVDSPESAVALGEIAQFFDSHLTGRI